jgi:hypothetical protein
LRNLARALVEQPGSIFLRSQPINRKSRTNLLLEKKIPNRYKAQQSIQTRDYSLRPQNLPGRVIPRSASCQKSKETPAKHNQSDLSALSLSLV